MATLAIGMQQSGPKSLDTIWDGNLEPCLYAQTVLHLAHITWTELHYTWSVISHFVTDLELFSVLYTLYYPLNVMTTYTAHLITSYCRSIVTVFMEVAIVTSDHVWYFCFGEYVQWMLMLNFSFAISTKIKNNSIWP